jgi:hypothetical protein
MRKPHRRAVLAAASLLALFALAAAPASASTAAASTASGVPSGVKGAPQPELTPFRLGASSTGGSVAIEPDGSLVVAYEVSSGHGKTFVCVLSRASHKCTSTITLSPLSGDTESPDTYAFVSGPNTIEVLQGDCCDGNPSGGDLLYTSTDGGFTFGPPVRVGTLSTSAAVLVGRDIVFAQDESGSFQVESIPVAAAGPPPSVAIPFSGEAGDVGVTGYHDGVLAGDDNVGSPDTVRVAYAARGSDFDRSASYHVAGTFRDESLVAMSGPALLTEQASGSDTLELRLFNGKSYGPAHAVPHTRGGGPEWFGLDTDPSGVVHVFGESTHLARTYDLYEESTSAGTTWTSPLDLGYAGKVSSFAAGLDASGSGLVLGTPGTATGYPVLAGQRVSFSLARSSITAGHSTTGSGQARAAAKGRLIALQAERSGRWYTVVTTHENAAGAFSFTITGHVTGAHVYRAVASDLAGYVQYGYSAARTLRVTS